MRLLNVPYSLRSELSRSPCQFFSFLSHSHFCGLILRWDSLLLPSNQLCFTILVLVVSLILPRWAAFLLVWVFWVWGAGCFGGFRLGRGGGWGWGLACGLFFCDYIIACSMAHPFGGQFSPTLYRRVGWIAVNRLLFSAVLPGRLYRGTYTMH